MLHNHHAPFTAINATQDQCYNVTQVNNHLSPQSIMLHKSATTFNPNQPYYTSPTTFHCNRQCYTTQQQPFTLMDNATQANNHLSPQSTMLHNSTTTFHHNRQCYTTQQPSSTTIDNATQVNNHLSPQLTILHNSTTTFHPNGQCSTQVSNHVSPQWTMLHKPTTTFHTNRQCYTSQQPPLTQINHTTQGLTSTTAIDYATQVSNHVSPQWTMLHKPTTTFPTNRQCYTSQQSPFTLIDNDTQVSNHLLPKSTILHKSYHLSLQSTMLHKSARTFQPNR